MRIKLLSVLAIALVITACASFAIAKSPLPGKDTKLEAPAMISGSGVSTRAYFEGFEGVFPPAGWTQGITNATNTWQQLAGGVEGAFSAYTRWDSYVAQNETLEFTHLIDVAGGEYVLGFQMAGSIGQTWDLNATETVEINGATVFDFDSSVTAGYMVFDQYFIDLSGFDGLSVTITFRYAGLDGDAHYIDAVTIDDGTGYVVPPVSFCEYLEEADGTGMFYGDTCDGMNMISALGCEAYSEAGLEDYYEVEVAAGGSFTATVTNTADGALWVVAECSAAGGAFTCLGYADDTLSGDPEVVSYTNTSGMDEVVYLVIDSWGTDSCGTYEMDFQGNGAVPNEFKSMGEIKSTWR